MSEIKVNSIKGVGASVAALSINNSDGTCTANITNNLSNKNVLINGEFRVNQRGNQTGLNLNNYTLDRWQLTMNNGGTWSVSQSTDTPDGFANSIKLDCTTADASLGSGDYIFLRQKLEGQDCQAFAKGTSAAKQFAVSFYVKTNKSGVYTVELMDNDNNRVATKTFTVSDGNWNRYTLIFPADTTGAFDNDNAQSLTFDIWLGAGSGYTSGTFNTSSWAAKVNANRASSSNVNLADSTSNEFYLTGVQLEVDHTGSGKATDFEHRSFAQELLLCQRYYYQVTKQGNTASVSNAPIALGNYDSSSNLQTILQFPVQMRTNPSVVSSDTTNGFYIRRENDADFFDNFTLSFSTKNCARIFNSSDVSGSAGACGNILQETGDSNLAFNAEL